MIENKYSDPFSVCFNMMKIKYKDLDDKLSSLNILQQNDRVNVFINLESCFKYLSMIMDLEKKLILHRESVAILTSNIINLAGHYRKFFVNNGLNTKVYVYHTDFKSDDFVQRKYNEDYRIFYLTKFNTNPKFVYLTDLLVDKVLPMVAKILEFIPGIYYITKKNMDGSMIPYIIGESDKTRKNIIFGNDLYDTQYSLLPNYINFLIHRTQGVTQSLCTIPEYIEMLAKKDKSEIIDFINTFGLNYSSYCTLLTCIGDKNRSNSGLTGVGVNTLYSLMKTALNSNVIDSNITNPKIISNIFQEEHREEFIEQFWCTSIKYIYDEITEADKLPIMNNQIDRIDMRSLMQLNQSMFQNYRLLLEQLV